MFKKLKEKGIYLSPIFDWPEWFNRSEYSWVDYHILVAQLEDDRMIGRFELTLAFLGIGIYLQYVYDDSFIRELEDRYEDLFDE